jgi:hypothetical protein
MQQCMVGEEAEMAYRIKHFSLDMRLSLEAACNILE